MKYMLPMNNMTRSDVYAGVSGWQQQAEQTYKLAACASAAPGPGGARGSIPIEVRRVLPGAPLA